jgi:hypothetical protein
MMRCALFGIWALVAAGCGQGDDATTVAGSPSDVKTMPGAYDGYAIVDACPLSSTSYGILGIGSSWYAGVAPEDAGRSDALFELARDVIEPALAQVASVNGVGIGASCTLDAGVIVFMSDWRDVDRVFVLAGRELQERDLREEVGLHIAVATAH